MLFEKTENGIPIYDNERLDRVNDGLMLIQRTDGLTFGTDALLLAAYTERSAGSALEIGGGTGIISMLMLSSGKLERADVCEVQGSFAELSRRNALINGLDGKMTVLEADIRELERPSQYDLIYTNPPYMKTTSGKANVSGEKNIARHEVMGGIDDFLTAAKRLLKFGGRFCAVYRPDRLSDLMDAMRLGGVEPKRMTFVHADTVSLPSVVLVEGRVGGGVGLKITRPLFIYCDRSHKEESEDMKYILKTGSFPADFYLGNRRRQNG